MMGNRRVKSSIVYRVNVEGMMMASVDESGSSGEEEYHKRDITKWINRNAMLIAVIVVIALVCFAFFAAQYHLLGPSGYDLNIYCSENGFDKYVKYPFSVESVSNTTFIICEKVVVKMQGNSSLVVTITTINATLIYDPEFSGGNHKLGD